MSNQMNACKNTQFCFATLLLIMFTLFSSITLSKSFSTELQTNGTQSYSLAQVSNKYVETRIHLLTVSKTVQFDTDYEQLNKSLKIIKENHKVLSSLTNRFNLSEEFSETLLELRRLWNRHKSEIDELGTTIKPKIKGLLANRDSLLLDLDIWKNTDSLVVKSGTGKDFVSKIDSLIIDLSFTVEKLNGEINKLLTLQSLLIDEILETEQISAKVEKNFLNSKREILTQNANPIWELLWERQGSKSVLKSARNIIDLYAGETSLRVQKPISQIFIGFGVLFILFIILPFLFKYSRKIPIDDASLMQARTIFHLPFSAATLVVLFLMQLVFYESAEIFGNLVGVLTLLPLLRILKKLINSELKVHLYFFLVLVLLQKVKLASGSGTDLERYFLLGISSLAILFLIVPLYKQSFKNFNNKIKFAEKAIVYILFALFCIAFIANILGFVMLSLTLINGVLNSIYGILILYITLNVIRGLFYVLVKSGAAQYLAILRLHSDLVIRKAMRIINIIAVLIGIRIILKSFGLFVIGMNFITSVSKMVFTIGNFSIRLSSVIIFFFSIWLSVIVSKTVKFILDVDVLSRIKFKRGVAGTVSAFTFYFINAIGIVFAVLGSGIDINSFSIIVGALGVGIGFGLQDIVKNFISGVILIFERPIQEGDVVEIEEVAGVIRKIGIRSSIIKTWNGAEVIVPNGVLLSAKLTNWTFSDKQRRIEILFWITNLDKINEAIELIKKVALNDNRTLTKPAPKVYVNSIINGRAQLELQCWTGNSDIWVDLKSDLRLKISEDLIELQK